MSDEAADLTLVLDRYKRAVQADRDYLQEVEECRRSYASDQWLIWRHGRMVEAHRPKHRVRITVNKLIPAVESIRSTFLRVDPTIKTEPATDQDSDRKAAEVSKKVSRHYWRTLKMKKKVSEIVLKSCVDGNAWLRSRWDNQAGRRLPKFKEGADLAGMAGRVSYGDVESWVPEGDPVADVLMAGSVFMEPGAKDIDDAAWVLVVESLKKDEVEQRFKKELGKDGLGSDELNYLDEYNPAFEPENLASTGDSNSERVILFQCYERPTKKHAKGRLIFCTKGRKLRIDPLPKGEIRIVQITNIELVGERNGTSVVCQALPMQAEYNRTRSMGIEDKQLASRPQVLSPIGALDTDELDNEPGRVIEWDPGAAQGERPEWFRGPGPSPILYQELQILSDEIDDLMSRHDPSMGAMRGATSGKHAERSQAADASRFTPAMWNVEDAITTWGRYLLSDIKENLKGERIVRITGDNHKADVVKFMATDISDDCHLEYSLVSQLEWSTEKLRQTVMWLHSVGLLDKNQALEMLKFPIKDGIYEGSYNHRINARKENEFLRSGMMFPPVGGDDHPIHIMEHLAELSQPEAREEIVQYYQENNGKWPQWVVAILTHAQQHQKAIPGEKPAPVRQSVSLRGELDPRAAMAIGQKAAGQTGPAGAGGQEEPQGLATPPGGMSGEMYMAPGPTQEPGGVGGMEGTPGGELQ